MSEVALKPVREEGETLASFLRRSRAWLQTLPPLTPEEQARFNATGASERPSSGDRGCPQEIVP